MYDHIGLKVKDMDASVRFYTAALAPLGHVLCSSGDGYAGFGPKGKPALWLHAHEGKPGGTTATGAHVALRAADQATVDRFYKEAMKAGGKDNGKPGLRPDYGAKYYGAFVFDLDGNNVEAVCHK